MLRPGHAYRLTEILPHGPAMLLLDRLVGYEAESVTCELTIRADSPFGEDARGVPAWVGIEYMAQALGAFTGIARLQAGKKVQIEMLLGTRAYDAFIPYFPVGSRVEVVARLLFWDPDGVCAFACELRDGEQLLAKAEVKGYEPDDIAPFLQQIAAEQA